LGRSPERSESIPLSPPAFAGVYTKDFPVIPRPDALTLSRASGVMKSSGRRSGSSNSPRERGGLAEPASRRQRSGRSTSAG